VSDEEKVDLVVRGLTRDEIRLRAQLIDGRGPAANALNRACREQVAEWEREERDARSYTHGGMRLDFAKAQDDGYVVVGVSVADSDGRDGDWMIIGYDDLLCVENAARERDGKPRLMEEPGESTDVRVRAFQKVPQAIQAKAMEAATAEIEAEASEADPEVCGRLLVGQGSDTFDPVCGEPAGHAPPCVPARDATGYTDGAESFRRHLRVSPLDDLPGVCIEVEMEEMSGEAHADIDVPWAQLLPLLNRVREQRGLPRLVEEPPSDPLRLDIGAAEFAAAVGATDVHATLAEVRALGERATKLEPAERADEDSP
jgi:hypothetical protein